MKRLLCLVSAMNAGGAETFLMKLYRKLDKTQYQMDFCVNIKNTGIYDEEIKKMGGQIYYIPPKTKNILAFRDALTSVIRNNKYENVMRITSSTMGFMDLAIAKRAGAKVCIARSSNSSDGDSLKAHIAHHLGKILYSWAIDVKIAPSDLAAEYTFGKKAYESGEVKVICNALDLDVFKFDSEKRRQIREEFGLSDQEILLGHIGRFTEQKNHNFLIEVFKQVCNDNSNYKLLLIGTGELKESVLERCIQLGIEDKVIFAGIRSDIPALLSAMDLFVFPSLYEGMPNTVIEAQAAGLKCLVANTVTKGSNLGLVEFLSINNGVEPWIFAIEKSEKNNDRLYINRKLVGTPYDINYTVEVFIKTVF